ncbi:MAG: holo-ACP synthase [Candidatus Cloacimonadaceae bacterium]|nr:holo-ACP synthase [Candidatus Cloacimonadaceae bacterium]MDP3114274.1 holo-ACP synthase [Candidatus Cloacimonadaceae bacterium]
MIFGIGTDIISVQRVARVIERNPRFVDKVFTTNEIDYCSKKANPAQSYAARFAAKEALMKAIGSGWDGRINWIDIEIINDSQGKPGFSLHKATKGFMEDNGIDGTHLSLSHEKDYAVAFVVLVKN